MATTLQVQARALGDPTRHDIFRYLVDAQVPIDVAELTDHFGFNHNAIRQHLAKLVDAELVCETRAEPTGRGRPRLQYTVNPAAESCWGVAGPYERLSVLLTEVIRTGSTPVEVGRQAGRRRTRADAEGREPVSVLADQMARFGFDPTTRRRGDNFEITLRTCPFASAALSDPDTVCNLHLGLAHGAAEAIGGLVIDELVPRDPRRANCRLRCHTLATPSPA
jgi:predicted ArsR family transcriptional regulator